jgi:hypothetical protein
VQVFCMKIAEYSYLHEDGGSREQKTSSPKPSPTAPPAKGVDPDNVHSDPDGTKDGAETKDRASPDAIQGQMPDQDLPTCGKCKGGLSFPFWYCIFCEGRSRGLSRAPSKLTIILRTKTRRSLHLQRMRRRGCPRSRSKFW